MGSMMWEDEVVLLAKDLVADGTSEVKTSVIDTADFDEGEFRVWHGDVDTAAVMVYTLKENSSNSDTSPTPTTVTLNGVDGTGASLSSGTLTITESSGNLDDKCIRIGFNKQKLTKRYVFLSITCSVESHEIDKIEFVGRKCRSLPVTQNSAVAALAYT